MTTEIKYFDVLAAITRRGRTHWTRIGAAFPIKDGFKLQLNFTPLDPETEVLILPPKTKEADDEE